MRALRIFLGGKAAEVLPVAVAESIVTSYETVAENENIIEVVDELAQKKRSIKKIIRWILIPFLILAAAIAGFVGYLYMPEEGAYTTTHISSFNFNDVGTLLLLIAGIWLLIVAAIAIALIIKYIIKKKRSKK